MLKRITQWAGRVKRDAVALWIAASDPRTPLIAKAVAAAVAAYVLSPIDLIPDFIPVLGQLDELIILPLGIMLAVRLIPPELMAEHRAAAEAAIAQPQSTSGALAIIGIWTGLTMLVCWLAYREFSK